MATVARKLLGVTQVVVKGIEIGEDGVIFDLRPRWRRPRCGQCGRRAPGYDCRPARRWQHLAVGAVILWIRYAPRRVRCSSCGVRTEQVPWGRSQSRFTGDLEEMAAYLAQITDQTQVTRLLGIAWRTVGKIVARVVEGRLDPSRLDDLRFIGVDEFGYRRRQRYLTTVVDHGRRRVIWAGKGHGAQTLHAFFDRLGEKRTAALEVVTMDMSAGYMGAVRGRAPQAQIVFDRFHVQQLAGDAVDEVRREQVRLLEDPQDKRAVKDTRFVLLKNPWNLRAEEKRKLSQIERTNRPLYRAYLLKEALAGVYEYAQPKRAREALQDWLGWAGRSRLRPFVRVARTIRKHQRDILAYIDFGLTNGLVEGINNRVRMVARRAFGFHSAEALIAMVYLCCGGISLHPPLPVPT